MLLPQWSNIAKPVVGMLHLPPLPGAPLYRGDLVSIRDRVLRDLDALVGGGVDGLMIENFGDVPFHPARVPASVVAHVTALAAEVRRTAPQIPLGINILRNDGISALAVAHAVGAQFIRVNILCGARVTDQGIIQGIAHDLLRERANLGAADSIKILADIDVKHSAPLAHRELADEVDDTIHRGLADALIVSGAGTGKPTDPAHVSAVKRRARDVPVFIGSGATIDTIDQYLPHADAFIIGTAFKRNAIPANEVDPHRVREFVTRVRNKQLTTDHGQLTTDH